MLLTARGAEARAKPLNLTMSGPADCGTAERIEAAVGALVRGAAHTTLHATLTIWPTSEGYTAELRTGAGRRRVISAQSCEAVLEAATVVLALAIDPRVEEEAPSAWRAPARPQPEPASRRARPLRFVAGASSVMDTSTLPHVATGATLRAGLRAPKWSAALHATYWLPASATLTSDATLGGRFSWWTVALSGCFAARSGTPHLALCLAPELGSLQGTGTGARINDTAQATWLALTLTPELGIALNSRVVLRATGGIAVTLLGAHPFVLKRYGMEQEVHRPARISGRAGLGLDVLF